MIHSVVASKIFTLKGIEQLFLVCYVPNRLVVELERKDTILRLLVGEDALARRDHCCRISALAIVPLFQLYQYVLALIVEPVSRFGVVKNGLKCLLEYILVANFSRGADLKILLKTAIHLLGATDKLSREYNESS